MRSYGMTYLSLTFNFAFSADEKRGSELPRGRTSRSSSAGCDAPLPPPCDHRSARCSRVPSEAEVVGPPARTAGGSSAATIRCGGFADDAPHPILLDRVERSAPCPPVPSRFRGALALLLCCPTRRATDHNVMMRFVIGLVVCFPFLFLLLRLSRPQKCLGGRVLQRRSRRDERGPAAMKASPARSYRSYVEAAAASSAAGSRCMVPLLCSLHFTSLQ